MIDLRPEVFPFLFFAALAGLLVGLLLGRFTRVSRRAAGLQACCSPRWPAAIFSISSATRTGFPRRIPPRLSLPPTV